MKPGLATWTVTPVRRRSAYIPSASHITPALDAPYPVAPGSPRKTGKSEAGQHDMAGIAGDHPADHRTDGPRAGR